MLEGQLDDEVRLQIEQHVDDCEICRQLLTECAIDASSDAEPDPAVRLSQTEISDSGTTGFALDLDATSQVGMMVGGRYRLTRQLGQGGMGSVWVATDNKLQREVAIKLMAPRGQAHDSATKRFEREAMAIARLSSPHIVQVYDYGVDRGFPYIVMELLDGQPLSAYVTRGTRLPLGAVTAIVEQIAKALETAHEAGIIHRDLKPHNVYYTHHHGEALLKVIDFGVAKALKQFGMLSETTSEGVVLGTPYYMSPEQLEGFAELDYGTDLWALGVIAYQALTGARPFDALGFGALAVAIVRDEPTPPSQLVPDSPPEVDDFFQQALAKQSEDRFPSARAMAGALIQAAGVSLNSTQLRRELANVEGQAPPSSRSNPVEIATKPTHSSPRLATAATEQQTTPPTRTRRGALWLVAGAVGLVAAGTIGFSLRGSTAQQPASADTSALASRGTQSTAVHTASIAAVTGQGSATPGPDPSVTDSATTTRGSRNSLVTHHRPRPVASTVATARNTGPAAGTTESAKPVPATSATPAASSTGVAGKGSTEFSDTDPE